MGRKRSITALRRYGHHLLGEEGVGHASGRRRLHLNPAFAVVGLALVLFGNIAAAAAADSAVPGDFLYPVDRAYEGMAAMVGWDLDPSGERLEEASVLLARGEYGGALSLVADACRDDHDLSIEIESLAGLLREGSDRSAPSEQLHVSIAALADSIDDLDEATPRDRIDRLVVVTAGINGVAVAAGVTVPPGQDEEFVPPGQDEEFVPPGQDEEFVPPGQDEEFVPPGQDEEFVPPGQDEEFVPPGQDEEFVPPGQDEEFVPPGQDKDKKSKEGVIEP